ncbi:MAG: hypothetical protein JRG67_02460 [Deltaproteobacteria bacterium]|nr:hypothetical protein [Deltaproteobacteria bacterium]
MKISRNDASGLAHAFDQLSGFASPPRARVQDTFPGPCLQQRANQLRAFLLNGERAFLIAGQRPRVTRTTDTQAMGREFRECNHCGGVDYADGLGDSFTLDVCANAQVDRGRLPPHAKKVVGVLCSDRRPKRITQPGGNRDRRRRLRNVRAIGRNLAKNRVRKTGDPLTALHAYELDSVVHDGMGRHAL